MSQKPFFTYSDHKGQFPGITLKSKKSCQKKFLKIFHVVPGLAVKTNVFLYKNYTDESPSSKLRRGSHATS